jgi:hypothetical protein
VQNGIHAKQREESSVVTGVNRPTEGSVCVHLVSLAAMDLAPRVGMGTRGHPAQPYHGAARPRDRIVRCVTASSARPARLVLCSNVGTTLCFDSGWTFFLSEGTSMAPGP